MAISSIAVSSTDTVNTVTVTDASGISVVTAGEQGLSGPNSILGRSVADVTAGSSDAGTLLVYDHGNTNWTTTGRYSSTITVGGLTVSSGGVTSTPTLRVATVQYTDGDAAFIISDGGGVNIPALTVTTLTTAGKVTLDNNEIEGGNFDINGGDIASSVTIHKSPVITLAGDLSGNVTLTNLGNATLTATITADATALGTDTTGAYVATIVAGEGIDISGSGAETANVTVSAEDASDANKGIASFSATDFSVSSGAVTLQAERIQDLVGAMVSSNTESGIAVTYQDGDGTLDFDVGDFSITLTGDVTGAGTVTNLGNVSFAATIAANSVALGTDTTGSYVADLTAGEGIDVSGGGSETATITVSAEDATDSNKGIASFNSTDFSVSSGAVTLNAERVSDIVGAMVTSNTESGIAVTYQDGDNTLDFDVGDFDIALTGDVTGSGTVTNLGNVSIGLTIAANSVALSTDTTGDYVGTITGGTGIDSTAATSGEGTSHTLSIDLNELSTETTIADADFIAMVDATDDGSGKITFENLEDAIFASVSGDITIAEDGAATIANNSVALGTDTTGNYMIDIAVGEGLDVSHSQGEGSTATLTAELATETNAGVATFDGTDFTVSSGDVTVNAERVQDIVGAMVSSNTESGIAVTYQDGDGTLDFDVSDPTITIDGDVDGSATMTNLGNTTITATLDTVNSNVGSFGTATAIPAITVNAKGLVTAISTNSIATSFTLAADSGSNDTFNTGETLTFSGTSNEIETAVSNNAITIGLPDNVTIGGNLVVSGNYTVNGTTTTVSTATLEVEDPLIKLAKANNAADSVDIGIYGLYDTSGSQDLHAGLFRDASDSGKWKLFKSLQPEPTTTVNTSGTGYAKAILVADIEGNVTGALTGNASGTAATVTGAAQTNITSLGTLTALTVDDVAINGKVITMTGSSGDTATLTAGTNGTLDIATTDAAAAAANIQITADGTAELAGTTVTLDSGGGITLDADNGTITFADGGSSLGTITSSGYTGNVVGNVTGNVTGSSGSTTGLAATATALATARTIHGVSFDGTANIDLSEVVSDTVGAMFSSNTETGITATYQDGDNTIDLVVGTLNQDTTGLAATATALATARTIHGVSFDGTANIDLSEVISDTVGAMFSSNTETNITATYQDGDNTIDLVIGTLNQDTSGTAALATAFTVSANNSTDETVYPIFVDGATGSQGAESDTGLSYNPSSGNLTIGGELVAATLDISGNVDVDGTLETDALTINGTTLSETIADTVGAMVSSNTESGIAVAYDDGDNTLDFTVATLNQNTTGNAATATALATGRTIGMTGDVVWTSASFDGSGNVTGSATIQANSVALGTDTTGSYVTSLVAGAGVSLSNNSGESATPTVAIGQAVGTSDSVTFGSLVVDNFTLNGTELDLSSGDFTLDVAGDIILDADGGDVVLQDGGTQFGKLSKATNNITQFNTTDALIMPLGTTGQRPTGTAGMFRYNSTDGKFEGYTNAWGEIGGGGSGLFSTNKFSPNGSTTAFTLSTAPADEDRVMAFIDGVYQNKDSFTLSGTTITFDTAPENNKTLIVHVVGSTVSGANANLDSFSGDGSTTAFTLNLDPVTENNTQVYIDGVYQMKSGYAVSGTTLTFSAAPPNGTSIEVATFTQNTLNAPADDSVTTAKILDANVTLAKMAANSIDSNQYVDGSIDLAHMSVNSIDSDQYVDGSIDTAHIAADQITSALIADDQIDSEHIVDGSVDLAHMSVNSIDSDQYVDGSIDAAHIASNAVTSAKLDTNIAVSGTLGVTGVATFATHVELGDSDILKLGAGADLQIYHDGSNSYVKDSGTGDLYLQGEANVRITDGDGNKMFLGQNDGEVQLYYNGAQKIATKTGGIDVTGTVVCDGGNFDGAATFNDTGADVDFRVESNDSVNMLVVDGGNNKVLVSANNTASVTNSATALAARAFEVNGNAGEGSDTLSIFAMADGTGNYGMEVSNSSHNAQYDLLLNPINRGNVGIGTVAPSADTGVAVFLQIGSSSDAHSGLVLEDNSGQWEIQNNADLAFFYDASMKMIIEDGGNVGIGTTAPSDNLDVTRTSTDQTKGLTITNKQAGGYGSGIIFRSNRSDGGGDLKAAAEITTSGENSWNSDGTTRSMMQFATMRDNTLETAMTIRGLGNVGIGTTSPADKLHVNGGHATIQGPSTSAQLTLKGSDGTVDGYVYGQDAQVGFLDQQGHWAYKHTHDTDHRWFVDNSTKGILNSSGVLTVTSVTETSDYRLKENISNMDDGALTRVLALTPRKFTWKDSGDGDEGFIAHELDAKEPKLVHGKKDGVDNQAVAYGRMTTLLVKAIQEQQTIIEDLKARIEALEA